MTVLRNSLTALAGLALLAGATAPTAASAHEWGEHDGYRSDGDRHDYGRGDYGRDGHDWHDRGWRGFWFGGGDWGRHDQRAHEWHEHARWGHDDCRRVEFRDGWGEWHTQTVCD